MGRPSPAPDGGSLFELDVDQVTAMRDLREMENMQRCAVRADDGHTRRP
jgi:hypothetical protein